MSRKNKYVSKRFFKRVLSVFVIGAVLISFASCGGGEGDSNKIGDGKKLQETTVITRNFSEKYSDKIAFFDGFGFVEGGTRFSEVFYKDNGGVELDLHTADFECTYDGYNLGNVPSSVVSVGKYVFYLNEDGELHRINTESKADDVIIKVYQDPENIIYSDCFMIIYGTQDGYNYSHFLYDVKKESFIENEIIKGFSESHNTAFVGLLGDKLFYIENAQYASRNSVLKCCNLTDNTVSDIYVSDDGNEEYISGVAACDPENNCLYYCVDYYQYDKKTESGKYGWKIVKYNNETGKNEEQYNAITMDYAQDNVYLPEALDGVFAVGGELYGINGTQFYNIVDGVLKIAKGLPAGEKTYVGNDIVCYQSNDKNILMKNDNALSIDEAISETSGLLGCFNNGFWYSTENYLCKLNEKNMQLEEKVMFNGFIISAADEHFICYGKPVEKHDVTGPFGEQSTALKEGDEGIYKVAINETEKEEIIRDVFLVGDEDKSKAVSIVDEIHGLEIMKLVSSPVITANDTTYKEGVVNVSVSGKFRMAEDLWIEKTTVFTVNLSNGTCATSDLWDSVVSVYNSGY